MNIARILRVGLFATALVVGCGSDKTATTQASNRVTSPLAGCVTGSTTDEECQACFESKCTSEVEECYGPDYSGGVCKELVACSKDDEDPCNAPCAPDSECSSCLMETLMPCLRKNCPDACARSIQKGTCADLVACCEIVSNSSAKTGCLGIANGGNETICFSYYSSLRAFCE